MVPDWFPIFPTCPYHFPLKKALEKGLESPKTALTKRIGIPPESPEEQASCANASLSRSSSSKLRGSLEFPLWPYPLLRLFEGIPILFLREITRKRCLFSKFYSSLHKINRFSTGNPQILSLGNIAFLICIIIVRSKYSVALKPRF